MKQFFTVLLLLFVAVSGYGQGSISGIVTDTDSSDPLIGATVILEGTSIGTITDIDGSFTISNVEAGTYNVQTSYVGYLVTSTEVVVTDSNVDVGNIGVGSDAIGLDQVNVIANVAVDRKTPVAVSTLKTEEIEAKIGNQEFPELLKSTPSVYATKSGGGYGDARINVRGFNQRNIAVMINGIPVNDMENGWVYWSNWAGLSDVTRTMQVQRGLGASKLAIASVGGTINLITKTADMERGGSVFSNVGNDGYLKYGLTLSSGRTDKGWAFTFSGSRTTGNGYVDATYIDAWSYFGSVTKEIGDNHQLVLTAIGAPQRHGQRSFRENLSKYVSDANVEDFDSYEDMINQSTVSDFDERREVNGVNVSPAGNVRYNSDWGFRDGEVFNIRENFYHKPQIALNHYWDISPKTFLATSAYYSIGRGGGTGDRGSIDGRGTWGYRDSDGLIRVDDIVSWNSGTSGIDGFPADGKFQTSMGSVATERDGLIKRASMNEHDWLGVLSTINTDLSDNLNLVAGVDLRQYTGLHYRKVVDMMGNDIWLDPRDQNDQSTIIDVNNDGDTEDKEVGKLVNADDALFGNPGQANKINYDNDGVVGWQGVFGYLEYSTDNLSVVGGGAFSNTSYKRVDRFNYLEGSENETSETFNFPGYQAKLGANLNIDDKNNIFVNTGIISKAPTFDAVFPNFNNLDTNPDAINEQVIGLEAGYGFRTSNIGIQFNLYRTSWNDRSFTQRYQDANGNDFYANIQGIDAVHQGVELELDYGITRNFNINGFASVGDWQWKNNVDATISDDNNNVVDEVLIYADGVKVGDAAQTTLGIGADYTLPFGLGIDAEYQYYDNLYTNFDPTNRSDATIGDGGVYQTLELPSYGVLNAGLKYNFDLAGVGAQLRLNVYNVLDELYVAEANEPRNYDPADTSTDWLSSASGFFGFGRTWTVGLKVKF